MRKVVVRDYKLFLAMQAFTYILTLSCPSGEVFPELLEKVGIDTYFSPCWHIAKSHLPLAEKLALGEKLAEVGLAAVPGDVVRYYNRFLPMGDFGCIQRLADSLLANVKQFRRFSLGLRLKFKVRIVP